MPLDKNKNPAYQHTWNIYQKLHDQIFQKNIRPIVNGYSGINFEQNIFTTELNVVKRGKSHKEIKKDPEVKQNVKDRKEHFFTTNFIQEFPVVVIACGDDDYITPDEFKRIFGNVTWQDNNPHKNKKNSWDRNWFYTHYNEPKLVIHTTQLSNGISDDLLEKIGKVIRDFLFRTDPEFCLENGGREMYEAMYKNPELFNVIKTIKINDPNLKIWDEDEQRYLSHEELDAKYANFDDSNIMFW